jgi:hypothetical protein
MPNLKYGKIHCDVDWQWPTLEIFNNWKEDFLKIPGVLKYEIYVLGRFPDVVNGKDKDLKTRDIDIILVGDNNIKEIEEIIYQGARLGIEKYNVYVDMQWCSSLQIQEGNTITPYKNTVYMHSDKWIVDDVVIVDYKNAKQISEHLWSIECYWPTFKQIKRVADGYTYPSPVKIC